MTRRTLEVASFAVSNAITLLFGRTRSIGKSGSRREPAPIRAAMSSRVKRLPDGRNTLSILGRGRRAPKSPPTASNWTFLPMPRNWRQSRFLNLMKYRRFSRQKEESNDVEADRRWFAGVNHLRDFLGCRRAIRVTRRAQLHLHRRSYHWPSPDADELCRRSAKDRATLCCGRLLLLERGHGPVSRVTRELLICRNLAGQGRAKPSI